MGKVEQSLDGKQGRITLEHNLLEYAGINRDIIAVGVGRYWRLVAP
jgi:DNA-binding transcriptional regulator/RsmH inhibitor MraZ